MGLGVNQVDEKGVREEDSCRVVRVVRVEVRVSRKDVRPGEEAA